MAPASRMGRWSAFSEAMKMRRTSRWMLVMVMLASLASAATLNTVPTLQASSLLLNTADTRILKVADLSISSSAGPGFSLSITSGALAKGDGQTPIPFQVVTVADQAPAPTAADFTSPSGAVYVFSTTSPGSVVRALYIRYQAAALQDPGNYNASIEVTVVDN